LALETLRDVKEIGGFKVYHIEDPMDLEPAEASSSPVLINHRTNSIVFTLQNRPIKEVGVNGCQVLTLIQAAALIIQGLGKKYPCKDNDATLLYLNKAIDSQNNRTKERELRGVEGHSKL
jgi:hypothetical protein